MRNNLSGGVLIAWGIISLGMIAMGHRLDKKADSLIKTINDNREKMKEEVNTVGTEDWKEDVFKEV